MSDKLKKSSDYPSLYVRTNPETLGEINSLVDEILSILIKKKADDEKQPKRNEVISQALIKGLNLRLKELKK